MLRLFALTTGLLVAATAAFGADMPVKAPKLAVADPCSLTSCSGFYVGGDLMGVASNINGAGPVGVNQFLSAGGIVGAHVGYQYWNGRWFAAIEVGVGYQTPNEGAAFKLGTDRIVGTELVKLGYGLAGIFGSVPVGPASPTQAPSGLLLPESITEALITPYLISGAMQRGGTTQMVTGAGSEFLLSRRVNLAVDYLYGAPQDGKPSMNLVRIGVNYKF